MLVVFIKKTTILVCYGIWTPDKLDISGYLLLNSLHSPTWLAAYQRLTLLLNSQQLTHMFEIVLLCVIVTEAGKSLKNSCSTQKMKCYLWVTDYFACSQVNNYVVNNIIRMQESRYIAMLMFTLCASVYYLFVQIWVTLLVCWQRYRRRTSECSRCTSSWKPRTLNCNDTKPLQTKQRFELTCLGIISYFLFSSSASHLSFSRCAMNPEKRGGGDKSERYAGWERGASEETTGTDWRSETGCQSGTTCRRLETASTAW